MVSVRSDKDVGWVSLPSILQCIHSSELWITMRSRPTVLVRITTMLGCKPYHMSILYNHLCDFVLAFSLPCLSPRSGSSTSLLQAELLYRILEAIFDFRATMRTTTIDPCDISAAEKSIPKDTPIVMLNLLRWREQAEYSNHPDLAPCTGQEAFLHRYVPAFNEIAARVEGIGIFWLGAALARLVGPADEIWDTVALVRYPSFAAFRAVAESLDYKAKAQHHRLAALEDARLIATVEGNLT